MTRVPPPLIMPGPGIEEGRRVATPVSLIDAYLTICETAGVKGDGEPRPDRSLLDIANGANPDRTVFSEYHATASITGIFMVRFGRFRYVHYQGHRPQLFDLEADPFETRDLALEPGTNLF